MAILLLSQARNILQDVFAMKLIISMVFCLLIRRLIKTNTLAKNRREYESIVSWQSLFCCKKFLKDFFKAVILLSLLLRKVISQAEEDKNLCQHRSNSFATEKGIPVYSFDKLSQHLDEIEKIDYDIAVTASFGQILNEKFLFYCALHYT